MNGLSEVVQYLDRSNYYIAIFIVVIVLLAVIEWFTGKDGDDS